MWSKSLGEQGEIGTHKEWYKGGTEYWNQVEAN